MDSISSIDGIGLNNEAFSYEMQKSTIKENISLRKDYYKGEYNTVRNFSGSQ